VRAEQRGAAARASEGKQQQKTSNGRDEMTRQGMTRPVDWMVSCSCGCGCSPRTF
jgi:hypothetical protein